jgi:chromosome segregation ATPase
MNLTLPDDDIPNSALKHIGELAAQLAACDAELKRCEAVCGHLCDMKDRLVKECRDNSEQYMAWLERAINAEAELIDVRARAPLTACTEVDRLASRLAECEKEREEARDMAVSIDKARFKLKDALAASRALCAKLRPFVQAYIAEMALQGPLNLGDDREKVRAARDVYEATEESCAGMANVPEQELAELRRDRENIEWLAEHCYREGGRGGYAKVYTIAHSDVWPVAGHALNTREKRDAFRNAIKEARAIDAACAGKAAP